MSVRDRVTLLLVGCLGCPSASAFAQQSRATDVVASVGIAKPDTARMHVLRRDGALVPYATGGLGGVFNYGDVPSVTLRGELLDGRFLQPVNHIQRR